MSMKKIAILTIVGLNCWAAMPWEIGWAMGGTSTYAINNQSNYQLLLECNEQSGSLYLRDEKRNEVNLGKAVTISVNNDKMIVPTSIDTTSGESDKRAWGNFVYSLYKSKMILVNNKKFEPNNSEKLSEIVQACIAYDETDNNVEQNTITPQTTELLVKVSVHYEQTKMSNIPITVPIVHLVGINEQPFHVKEMIVNRGNCKVTSYGLDKLKKPIVYGEERTIPLVASSTCSTILEIVIHTNLGSSTYVFQ